MIPGMQDGRCFTSYLPNCQLNENIMSLNNISNNISYKDFLQSNADVIMDNFKSVCKEHSCDCFVGVKEHLKQNNT